LAARIRLYELARELGLSNKETLDLALSLGIGVKSHSSSIEDAQADRVRRKADREGLRRPVQPEEPKAPAAVAGAHAPVTAGPVADGPGVAGPPDALAQPEGRRLVTSTPEIGRAHV
jgi:translation initiation factor IF-2